MNEMEKNVSFGALKQRFGMLNMLCPMANVRLCRWFLNICLQLCIKEVLIKEEFCGVIYQSIFT
jgi:hypothetical protein